MAWPRSKNSTSSAQPGTQPHDGVQATVTPAHDAEPSPGSGQNTGVSGTTHSVASEGGTDGGPDEGTDASGPATSGTRAGRRRRPVRYAHSADDQASPPLDEPPTAPPPPSARISGIAPPTGEPAPGVAPPAAGLSSAPAPGTEPPAAGPLAGPGTDEPLAGTLVPGTVLPPQDTAGNGRGGYDGSAGLVYEAPLPAHGESPGEPAAPVRNEGLAIFGGVATTEVPGRSAPTRELERQPAEPPDPGSASPPGAGAAWNEPIAPPPVASSGTYDRKPNPFGRIRRIRPGGGQPADDGEPRANVRDLPPDVQLRFIRDRVIITLFVGVLSFILVRSWALSATLVIIAWILDMVRRQRTAALYVNGGAHPGARKATSRQLRKMRRYGYFTLDARPIPDSREFIDHLVIGPTGAYAIDSEKWNPKLPIRTWNNKKLYHGPASQKARLEHAVWEASQASAILSSSLGTEIKVRPALAIYGPKIPWNVATIRNVDVFTGPALRKYLKGRGRMKDGVDRLTREEVRRIYDTAARMLPDVAQTHTPVG